MKIGEAGDSLSLVRVILAMLVGAIVLGGIGYGFDLVVGPAINMSGWWTVFASGGLILGGMVQATREFAVPQPAERRAVAARLRARAEAEAAADEASQASPVSSGDRPAPPAPSPEGSGTEPADAAPDRIR